MSETTRRVVLPPVPWRRRMRARDPHEEHRVSTPLELLFDLTFVVAVSAIAAALAEHMEAGDGLHALVPFASLFFAVYWAWVNFTWFASAFDVDDVPYRLMTLVQMVGVLVLAASVPHAFGTGDYVWPVVAYVVMRVSMVGQWLRVGRADPASRTTARAYVTGVLVVQALWVVRLLAPAPALGPLFVVLVLAEMAVPALAERYGGATPWHPDHMAERYGLFTLIVLGESVLGATVAVQHALGDGGLTASLAVVGVAGLVLIFGLWWLYFLQPFADGLQQLSPGDPQPFVWGYLHYGVFGALAALGGGLEVFAARAADHVVAGEHGPGAWPVALPVAVFLLLMAACRTVLGQARPADVVAKALAAAATLLVAVLVPDPAPAAVLLCVPVMALVARGVRAQHRRSTI